MKEERSSDQIKVSRRYFLTRIAQYAEFAFIGVAASTLIDFVPERYRQSIIRQFYTGEGDFTGV